MTTGNHRFTKLLRIRAVILDYGEVLSLRPEPEILRRMARVFRIEPSHFFELYVSSRDPYDQGLMTAERYWLNFARRAGIQIDTAVIEELRVWDTQMWSRINPLMTHWLEALHKAGLTTALLSNMESDMAIHARKNFSWFAHFHHQLLSCELGLIKPDPAIFHECVRRVGVKPAEALFVDDRQPNVAAAKKAGITAIRFLSVKQLRTDLLNIGFEILPLMDERKEPAGFEF